MTVKLLKVIAPITFTDRKSKLGNTYRAADVQAIAVGDDGSMQVCAWLLMQGRDKSGNPLQTTDLPPGDYAPIVEFRIDTRDRRPLYEIVGFKPAKA